jgi:hypothetical protein
MTLAVSIIIRNKNPINNIQTIKNKTYKKNTYNQPVNIYK